MKLKVQLDLKGLKEYACDRNCCTDDCPFYHYGEEERRDNECVLEETVGKFLLETQKIIKEV